MGNELVGTGLAMLINKYIDGAILFYLSAAALIPCWLVW